MATTQAQRGEAFRDLHYGKRLLVLANPWDAGSARLLAGLGFQALATTSAGLSFSLGLRDGAGQVGWEQALANAAAIVDASGLPVTADLEQGYGATPEECWRIIRDAARAGLVGASIEDASGDPLAPILPLGQAVERVRAAAEAARALDFPFMLCARTENFMHGRADLDDTLHRLKAYADAGADVLYAPGVIQRDQILSVVRAVAPKPVNVLVGIPGIQMSLEGLFELGVRRVSLGSSLARVAYGAFYNAASELARRHSLQALRQAMSPERLNDLFRN